MVHPTHQTISPNIIYSGDLDNDGKKNKKPLPPLPAPGSIAMVPTGVSSWTSPTQGWATASVSRRSDSVSLGKTTRSSIMFSKEISPLQLGTPPSPSLHAQDSTPTTPTSTTPPSDMLASGSDDSFNNDPEKAESREEYVVYPRFCTC